MFPSRAIALVAGLSLALAGCTESSNDTRSYAEQCVDSKIMQELDQDCDQVYNIEDVLPGADDNADYDGDGVINTMDLFPTMDDTTVDTDGDGTPNYIDTFIGDNSGDLDNDGIINLIDSQPYAPNTVKPPATYSNDELVRIIMEGHMERALIRKLAEYEKDSDGDGMPDRLDGSPTWTTNDMDNDGDPDFFDPEPNDPFIYSSNDPLNLSNEEFWEKD